METDKNGETNGKQSGRGRKKLAKRTPAIAAITEKSGDFTLFLYRLNDSSVKEFRFKNPDRCAKREEKISDEILKKYSVFLKNSLLKDEIIATVFLTSEKPCAPLFDLNCDEDSLKNFLESRKDKNGNFSEEMYFGIDRRCAVVKRFSDSILFEKAIFLEISDHRKEAIFCCGENPETIIPIDFADKFDSAENIVEKALFEPSEISDFAEKFSPDAIFIMTPFNTEKTSNSISHTFAKMKKYNVRRPLFCRSDDRDLVLYFVKKLKYAFEHSETSPLSDQHNQK